MCITKRCVNCYLVASTYHECRCRLLCRHVSMRAWSLNPCGGPYCKSIVIHGVLHNTRKRMTERSIGS